MICQGKLSPGLNVVQLAMTFSFNVSTHTHTRLSIRVVIRNHTSVEAAFNLESGQALFLDVMATSPAATR